MTKHSKNNTASSIFSYAEYKKLDYGTKRQRLGHESMRAFDACALCLQRARTPLACTEGHLFCKECVYADLLAQKKAIKREQAALDALARDAAAAQEEARVAARARVLDEFERGQLGLASAPALAPATSSRSAAAAAPAAAAAATAPSATTPAAPALAGTKRKFAFDASAAEAAALAAEDAAAAALAREHAAALRARLPDFWLPSLTPTHAGARARAEVKLHTACRGGAPAHALRLKDLVPVTFTRVGGKDGEGEDGEAQCPSCKKALSNSTLLCLMRPCAHVVCKTCTDALVRPAGRCVVCDAETEPTPLAREGTGFAGGGLAETSRAGIAFQG